MYQTLYTLFCIHTSVFNAEIIIIILQMTKQGLKQARTHSVVDYIAVHPYLSLSVSVQMWSYDLLQLIKYAQKSCVLLLVEALRVSARLTMLSLSAMKAAMLYMEAAWVL